MIRKTAQTILALILLVIILPAVAISIGRTKTGCTFPLFQPAGIDPADPVQSTQQVRIFFHRTGAVKILDLEEYLLGVVAAEMPVSFHPEALKAQAVAARTYTLKHSHYHGGSGCTSSPEPADLCTNSCCCQDWIDLLEASRKWPEEKRELYLEKIRLAVQETAGEGIVYRGTLIDAVYHSTCGGRTESSVALWKGEMVPYLNGVSCPYCSHSPRSSENVTLPITVLAGLLPPEQALAVSAGDVLPAEVLSFTTGGRVAQLRLGDLNLSGREARSLFNLPSTDFELRWTTGGLLFECCGYGHGVGLCQYGADGAAAAGLSYRDILSFYYPGTSVTIYKP